MRRGRALSWGSRHTMQFRPIFDYTNRLQHILVTIKTYHTKYCWKCERQSLQVWHGLEAGQSGGACCSSIVRWTGGGRWGAARAAGCPGSLCLPSLQLPTDRQRTSQTPVKWCHCIALLPATACVGAGVLLQRACLHSLISRISLLLLLLISTSPGDSSFSCFRLTLCFDTHFIAFCISYAFCKFSPTANQAPPEKFICL